MAEESILGGNGDRLLYGPAKRDYCKDCKLPEEVFDLKHQSRINGRNLSNTMSSLNATTARLEGSIKLLGEHLGRFAGSLSRVDAVETRLSEKIDSLGQFLISKIYSTQKSAHAKKPARTRSTKKSARKPARICRS
jgi:hypothetical protein